MLVSRQASLPSIPAMAGVATFFTLLGPWPSLGCSHAKENRREPVFLSVTQPGEAVIETELCPIRSQSALNWTPSLSQRLDHQAPRLPCWLGIFPKCYLLLTWPLFPLYALHHADLDMAPSSAAILRSAVPGVRGPAEVRACARGCTQSMLTTLAYCVPSVEGHL